MSKSDDNEDVSAGSDAGNTKGISPPSATRADIGQSTLNSWTRSILMSQISLELFVGFNKKLLSTKISENNDSSTMPPPKPKSFGSDTLLQLLGNPLPDFSADIKDNLLSAAAQRSKRETNITKAMVQKLQDHFSSGSGAGGHNRLSFLVTEKDEEKNCFRVLDEAQLIMDEDEDGVSAPKLDVTITLRDTLLAFVEVGLTKTDLKSDGSNMKSVSNHLDVLFWEKIHQAIMYLKILRKAKVTKNGDQFEAKNGQTILACVLVMDRGRKRGRIAVFACEPKGEEEFRLALMWRKEAKKDALDLAYGRFINGVMFLKETLEGKRPSRPFVYLGPNCCKVKIDQKDYVLRSYDTRTRTTFRSPAIYKEWQGRCSETKEVLRVEEAGATDAQVLEFGCSFPVSEESGKRVSTLFTDVTVNATGAIEVIAHPFREGCHKCTHIDQAIEVATDLKHLHDAGFVHGDIRGSNTVFSQISCLIDFDFGGKVGKRVYPDGYVRVLADGQRQGKVGETILQAHDVRALWDLLWNKHILHGAESPDGAVLLYSRQQRSPPETIDELLGRLRALKDAGVTSVEMSFSYEEFISEHFLPKPTAPSSRPTNADNRKQTPVDAQCSPAGGFISHAQLARDNPRKRQAPENNENSVLQEKHVQPGR